MKSLCFICFILLNVLGFSQTRLMKGSYTDTRDGKIYPTVSYINSRTKKIDTWMTVNLAYEMDYGCYKYDNHFAKDSIFYLYDHFSAFRACPEGWYLPSNSQLEDLIAEFGDKNISGYSLKSRDYWTNFAGNDSIGFNATPSGYFSYNKNEFLDLKTGAYFWSQTAAGNDNAWIYYLDNKSNAVNVSNEAFVGNGYSVRCMKRQ